MSSAAAAAAATARKNYSGGDQRCHLQKDEASFAHYIVCGVSFVVNNNYRPVQAIGTGAYGLVCSAVMTGEDGSHRNVAIKKVSHTFENVTDATRLLREIRLLKHFHHENVLELVDIIRPQNYDAFDDVYIVTDLMDTDLSQIIRSSQTLTDEHVQYFIYQILRGLLYLHSAGVIHRDLKPGNILVNANCDAKICDFGLARPLNSIEDMGGNAHMTYYVTTRWYRAPEVLLCDQYSKPLDVWSTGCILGELIGRKPLFPGKNHWLQMPMIASVIGSPSEEEIAAIDNAKAREFLHQMPPSPKRFFSEIYPTANPLAWDLLEHMLTFDPDRRYTVEQCLAHPYLENLHDLSDEPTCDKPFCFDPNPSDTPQVLKSLVFREMMDFHPSHFHELSRMMEIGMLKASMPDLSGLA